MTKLLYYKKFNFKKYNNIEKIFNLIKFLIISLNSKKFLIRKKLIINNSYLIQKIKIFNE